MEISRTLGFSSSSSSSALEAGAAAPPQNDVAFAPGVGAGRCAGVSIVTAALDTSPSSMSLRASGLMTCCWMARRTGRAPYTGLYPTSASHALALSVTLSEMRRSVRREAALLISRRVIAAICSRESRLKSTISSSRLMNSGARCARTSSITPCRADSAGLPSGRLASDSAPRLDVITMSVLANETRLPAESVSCPSSSTCSSSVATSRWAFSNSSKSSTQYGRRRTASVRMPPSS
mmetsp:Transcript_508/g.1303  ORF Transcript_508/g.1303 Transcript_508/m.1303 type:complete len:236 (-) Transcript_508:166-873(-)